MTYTGLTQLDKKLSFARARAQHDGRIRFVTAQAISLHMPQKRDFIAMGPKDWATVFGGKWERQTYKEE